MVDSSALSVTTLIEQGFAHHRQGRLAPAQASYRHALTIDSKNFDACHLLGVVARQLGDPAAAVALISEAIGINPLQAAAHCNLGAALQDIGQSQQALVSFEHAIELQPGYVLALSNRGNALRMLGRGDDALHSYDQALAFKPDDAALWCTRANLLQTLGRFAEALVSAERALALQGGNAPALYARANALHGLRRYAEAVDCYALAINASPDYAEAYCGHAVSLQRLRRFDAALRSYDRAIALRPTYGIAHHYRANTLKAIGLPDAAIASYRLALAHGADPAEVAYEIAALGGATASDPAPSTAPAGYVKNLFDRYAEHFDEHLTQYLDYRTPALINAAIERHFTASLAHTLDLGCGTGLCGVYLRSHSHTLDGIDLSEKMLAKARTLDLYDTLACTEISAFLSDKVARYDLLAAADVLVYFGDLSSLFRSAYAALRPNGGFCFSVEAGHEHDYFLGSSGRFTHRMAYLERMAKQAGFDICEAREQPGRTENGMPVPAYVLFLKKTEREK